ncbi:hypothetical protein JD844_001081 [Phrynosoma platyrhinos]|uniref:Ig-like domain-containing protein n=1 Tax=Phrynosoma platyrhinos TaxID=52577 RepID=A0ABQ7T943_PHRPL|nr:hypothetical protein JD844_001081 [Phrynosoma platyrhinos]
MRSPWGMGHTISSFLMVNSSDGDNCAHLPHPPSNATGMLSLLSPSAYHTSHCFMEEPALGVLQGEAKIIQEPIRTALDGKPLDLSCSHSSATTETIFWYRQFPNQGPQYIASGYSGDVKSPELEGVLRITKDRKSNVFAFSKVTWEDSAVYYCALSDTALHPGMFQSDAVFQLFTQKEIQEGQTVTLQCNFTTLDSSPYLFWYSQYVGREPRLVLRAYKAPAQKNKFFEGKYSTVLFMENKTVPLTIKDISLQEEAVYYCALRPTVSKSYICTDTKRTRQSDSISQTFSEMSIKEGQDALLHCTFNTTSSNPYLFWYRQFPNQSPGHILTRHKFSPLEPASKYSGTLNSKEKTLDLKIEKVSPADEAVYYCISQSDSVFQSETETEFQEGQTAVLHCNFTTTDRNPYLFWYRQYMGKEPQMIIQIILYKGEKTTQEPLIVVSEGKRLNLPCSHPSISSSERVYWYQQFLNQGPRLIVSAYSKEAKSEILETVTLVVSEDRKSSILSFTRVTWEDSAVYYCVLSDTVSHPAFFAVQELFA